MSSYLILRVIISMIDHIIGLAIAIMLPIAFLAMLALVTVAICLVLIS
jgi:hypothetical protein